MAKAQTNFRQNDVSRAIRATRLGGLDIESVVIDANANRITLMIRGGNCIPVAPDKRGQDADKADADA